VQAAMMRCLRLSWATSATERRCARCGVLVYTPACGRSQWLMTERESLHIAVSSESGRMPLPSAPAECRARAAFVVLLSGLVECPGMPVGFCMAKAEGAGLDVRSMWPIGCSKSARAWRRRTSAGFQVPGRSGPVSLRFMTRPKPESSLRAIMRATT
jgi:hypothetical protein